MNSESDQTDSQLVRCPCQHCSGHIEFDARGMDEGETRTVECPFCKMDTLIFAPPVVIGETYPPQIETPPIMPVWFGCATSMLELRSSAGTVFEVAEIKLFHASALQKLAGMKAEALKKLGGVSTGLGALGSLEWVIMASAAIGAVETVLSNQAANQGTRMMQEVWRQERWVRENARFFPVGMIAEIEHPAPERWHIPAQPGNPIGFIHSGDDFISIRDAKGVEHGIRWGAVEYFKFHVNLP